MNMADLESLKEEFLATCIELNLPVEFSEEVFQYLLKNRFLTHEKRKSAQIELRRIIENFVRG